MNKKGSKSLGMEESMDREWTSVHGCSGHLGDPVLPAIFWDASQVPEDCLAIHAHPAVKLSQADAHSSIASATDRRGR